MTIRIQCTTTLKLWFRRFHTQILALNNNTVINVKPPFRFLMKYLSKTIPITFRTDSDVIEAYSNYYWAWTTFIYKSSRTQTDRYKSNAYYRLEKNESNGRRSGGFTRGLGPSPSTLIDIFCIYFISRFFNDIGF